MSKKESEKSNENDQKKQARVGYEHVEIEVDALRDLLEKRTTKYTDNKTGNDDEESPQENQ